MAGHWYSLDGRPVHFVKQKGDPNKTRKTSLWDAIEQHLLPSVTTVKGDILKSEGLERWIRANRDRAHLELRFKDIPDEAYLAEVDREADRISLDARDRGTFVHKIIETFIENALKSEGEIADLVKSDDEIKFENNFFVQYYNLFAKFYREQELKATHVEKIIISEKDFVAGRCDWIGSSPRFPGPVVFADWKTQKFKEGRANFYAEWAVQLAAYAKGYGSENAVLLSVAIDTSDLTEDEVKTNVLSPTRIQFHVWSEGVLFWFDVFSHLAAVWRSPLGKDYDRKLAKRREHAVKRDPLSAEDIRNLPVRTAQLEKPKFPVRNKTAFPSASKSTLPVGTRGNGRGR